jgi:hypothetical protein
MNQFPVDRDDTFVGSISAIKPPVKSVLGASRHLRMHATHHGYVASQTVTTIGSQDAPPS